MICRFVLASAFLLTFAPSASAQDPLGWNAPRTLDLMERARIRRDLPRGDSTLQNYVAKAGGYVYFYLDRREDSEQTLVKVDQIALDLFWKAPDITKQRIVGMRDVDRLPNRMYYHLDHLTVVQNGLGDVIKIGDGDEVRDVPHPAAPGSDSIYDFRMADSVTLQLGGNSEQGTVRVYQIQVRPKRTDRSALVGSIFVDRATADIVRMTFTFTPASYVDRRLDYINISLDNGLFDGRHWLPAEQSVEIRRQLPELDFAAGAVIKGQLRIGGYAFNQPIPDSVFWGNPVSAASPAEREAYPFEQDIYAGINEAGLAPTPRMEELQALAAELVGVSKLSGLPPWRLYAPNASSVLRHNTAEGWYGGLGVTYSPSPTFNADFTAGYAFGAERAEFTAGIRRANDDVVITGSAYYNQPRDIGPFPGVAGAVNTIWSAFSDRDYTDTYFTRGVFINLADPSSSWLPGFFLRSETHTAATEIAPGNASEIGLSATREASPDDGRMGGYFDLGVVRFRRTGQPRPEFFVRFRAGLEDHISSADKRTTLVGRIDVGARGGQNDLRQFNFLLGGRETVPGVPYRDAELVVFGMARAELAHTIAFPWVRARLLGASLFSPEHGASVTSGGVGLGLLWDVIRVDAVTARGRPWRLMVSIRPDLWDML